MSITEGAQEALGRRVGPLPLYGWAAIGIGTILVVKLLRGGGGGGGGGGSTDFTLPDASADDGSSGGGTITTPTTPVTSPGSTSGSTGTPKLNDVATARWGSDVPLVIRNAFPAKTVASKLHKWGIKWGTTINLSDLRAAFKKKGITYGTTINVVDVRKLLKAK